MTSKFVEPDLSQVVTTKLPTTEEDGFALFTQKDFDKLKEEIANTTQYKELFTEGNSQMWIKVAGEGNGKYNDEEVYDDEAAAQSSCIRHKFTCLCEGYDVQTFYDVSRDYHSRCEWDTKDIGRHIIQIYHNTSTDPNTIQYQVVEHAFKKGIFMLSNRDIVTIETEQWEDDGSVYVLCKSIENHPNTVKEVNGSFVRSRLLYTGVCIQPLEDGKSMRYWCVTQADPGGWISSWIVNKAVRFIPKEFQRDMKNGMDLRIQRTEPLEYKNYYQLEGKQQAKKPMN
jgi:hypothetical protein